jgi:phosphocarrier protein
MSEAHRRVELTHAAGLHARPAVKLTRLAKTFAAEIAIAAGQAGPWIDAKSIVKVMAMKLPGGSMVHLRATGPDAPAAIAALAQLVERDFDEGEPRAAAPGHAGSA